MDEKTAKEIAKQLKRIADAMESQGKRDILAEKRKAKLEATLYLLVPRFLVCLHLTKIHELGRLQLSNPFSVQSHARLSVGFQ